MPILYKDAGVDVERGYQAVELMKAHVRKTFDDRVMGDVGSFGGLYSLEGLGGNAPVLVAGTDGVGTKLKIAIALDKHDTVGIDCVAMSVNDVVCQGARPLIFLDYIASAATNPRRVADIVKGIADGCVMAGCALIGGETAEMPGFYAGNDYDIAGFCVGIASRDKIVSGKDVKPGDAIIGLASSGVHSNGFSLVRRLVGDTPEALAAVPPELGASWGETLLTPTRVYVKPVLALMEKFTVKGAAHITGGGFIENIPRMLPEGCRAEINVGSWPVLPVFGLLTSMGGLPNEAAYNTFNMGIGMAIAVPSEQARDVVNAANALGESAYIIGSVVEGERGIALK